MAKLSTTPHSASVPAAPWGTGNVAADVRETAISTVILSEDRAWKIRKPVAYPFVDQRDPRQQRRLCEREVELNSRLAPDVYLGVVDVVNAATGRVQPATLMRRLPDDRCLSRLIRDGHDVRPELREIARTMAAFHLRAECGPRLLSAGQPATLAKRWHDVLSGLSRFTGTVLDAPVVDSVAALADEYIVGRGELFEQRIAGDKIVDGHGDLLADDVFCLSDGPAILDCLEFDDDLRCCDVLSDVASLAMECERLGHPELGEQFLAEYAGYTADAFPASLADHFIAYRAAVRCQVACLRHEQGATGARSQARQLLGIALRHLVRGRVVWVLVGGPPGVGKSTIAAGLGDALGLTTLRSDAVRRELVAGSWHGGPEWLSEHFSPDKRAGVYHEMLRRAELLSGMGESVVLDATWSSTAMRDLARLAAGRARCALVALRCDVAPVVAERRVARRIAAGADISMATVEVARRIAATFDPWPEAATVETGESVAHSLSKATAAVVSARRSVLPVASPRQDRR